MTGEVLAKYIKAKSEREGREIKKLDVNMVITFKKKDYEYPKKITYGYAFNYNEDGTINVENLKSNPGGKDFMRAYDMLDMLIKKPTGFDNNGKLITEDGKEIKNLVSAMKALTKTNEFTHVALMEKGQPNSDGKAF